MEERFMRRALEIARLGLGSVSPNPMVGCVIVHKGEILAEGYHRRFGGLHAEAEAITALSDLQVLSECEVYVSLEPCSHFGKTPPCADLLIRSGVKRVIAACTDPNPKVSGRGIEKLRQAGVEVVVGLLEDESRYLNRRFFVNQTQERPWVVLKWAQTADGFIARKNYSSQWISSLASRRLVHQWRSQEDAVLVGTQTAKVDTPRLDVRLWPGRNPIRVFLDRRGELNPIETGQRTIVIGRNNSEFFEVIDTQDFSVANILHLLWQKGIGSLMVEGGSRLIESFLESGLWDEARVFYADVWFGEGISAPRLPITEPTHIQNVGCDKLAVFENWHNFGKKCNKPLQV